MDAAGGREPNPAYQDEQRREQRFMTRIFLIIGLLGLLVFQAGCAAVGPDYIEPQIPVPAHWNNCADEDCGENQNLLANWWQALEDPVLTRLIDQAAAANLDVRQAASRVRQARLQRRQTQAALYPTVDATGSARKSGSHDNDGTYSDSELYAAGFDAGWELDVFGGVRRAVEASQADVDANVENLRDVQVTLLAEVAVNYADVRTYQARLAVAERNLATQEETWQLLDALSRAGAGDELAVTQARYNLESTRAKIPDLKVGLEAALNRLAVLTGKAPGSLHSGLEEIQPIPRVSVAMAVGIPADVVRQRPDIRQAERELAAQTARVGEATAELYPKFTLSGSIGLESLSLGDLFSSGSSLWSIGPSVSWPVFDAGAIRSHIGVQDELRQQALFTYEAVILSALEEVENALTAYAQDQHKIASLQAAAEAARQAQQLAGQRYIAGLTGFSDVLDAQRSLLSFEDQMTESQGAVFSDFVRIYKALGGGWQSLKQPPLSNASDTDKG